MSERFDLCNQFFGNLANMLKDSYEIIGSCNGDGSRYLVPIGTAYQITYYGKPVKSFRVSDHWNWYANTKKCQEYNYIQCESVDVPFPRKRTDEHATYPRYCPQVAIQLEDGKYHCVYGSKFIPKRKGWSWVEANPAKVIEKYGIRSDIHESN